MPEFCNQKLPMHAPTAQQIAEAASDIVKAVKLHKRLVNETLAELIGECATTIANIENQRGQKVSAKIIASISAKCGGEFIQPYMALFGHKAIPLHCEDAINALPALTSLSAKVAAAMSSGPGRMNHNDLAGMMSDLRAVDGVVSQLCALAADLGIVG